VTPLRILHVMQPADGGLPEHVRQLALGLVARGRHVAVAGPPDAAPRAELEAAGVRWVDLALHGGMVALGADLRGVRAIGRALRRGRFDLVHLHGQKAGLVGRLAALSTGTPAIYTPHALVYRTQLVREGRGRRARFVAARGMERMLGRRAAAIIAVSDEERRAAVADRLASPERVHTIHNGVAMELDEPPDTGLGAFRGAGPLLGFVAGLRDQKGLPTLLDALALLAAQGRPARCAIVGNGPMAEELPGRLAVLGLQATTTVLPFTGPSARYLAALDAFVLPSYWEGLPIGLLEAMAMGLPCVATAVGGTPEVIEDGVSGFLVPARDHEALADRLGRLMADAGLRAEMGGKARRRVSTCFAVADMVTRTEALYEAVAGA
jgi:glycosyltransferase involved in cell wall biosynthesis